MAHLELAGLEKRFDATVAVRAMSMTVERGQLVSLLGPSGCGKTTTLRMVAGFVAPTAGTIRLAGRQIVGVPPERRNIGMVFQSYALFPHMTVAGNVAFGLKTRGVGRADRDARTARALDLVGLSALAGRYPAQLSGGQQQRVALARALVIEPDVLLLDEPLSNLDAALRAEMRGEIRRLQRRLGITTLLVTHDQQEALGLSDRIVVMDRGELVEDATPEALSDRPRRLFTATFLGARTALPGRVVADDGGPRFVAEGGIVVRLDAPGPVGATHAVLRAARLSFAPAGGDVLAVPGRVATVGYLGDQVEFTVEAAGASIRVIRPTGGPLPAAGEAVTVHGGPDAVAVLSEPRVN
jgi:putative spermidine/putrescine transport system ATP-binding protein